MTAEQRKAHSARCAAWRKAHPDRARKIQKKWNRANPGKTRSYCRNWRRANAEYDRTRTAVWMKNNPGKMLRSWRRSGWRKAGIDPTAAEAVLAAHGGKCGCCAANKPGGKGWCVDHDHETGKIRGVLCNACNLAIGKLGDTLEGVLRAVKYLQQSQGVTQ
jgi:hypothetical protein